MVTGDAAYQHTAGIITEANTLIREADKQRQIKKITKVYKYNFGWSRKTAFLYFLKTLPEVLPSLAQDALKKYNLTMLYATCDKKQLSTIIKRLESIEARNDSRKVEEEFV